MFEELVNNVKRYGNVHWEHSQWYQSTANDIMSVEHVLGKTLPLQYTRVCTQIGYGEYKGFELFGPGEHSYSLLQFQAESRAYLPSGFLAIGENGAGDFYGFICHDAIYEEAIYVTDHEVNSLDKEPIAPDTVAFLLDITR